MTLEFVCQKLLNVSKTFGGKILRLGSDPGRDPWCFFAGSPGLLPSR